jgi:hypothetical protein
MATTPGGVWNGCGRSLSGADVCASSIGRSFRTLSLVQCCAFGVAIRCRPRHRPDAPYFRRNRASESTRSSLRRCLDVAVPCQSPVSVRSSAGVSLRSVIGATSGPKDVDAWANPAARSAFGSPSGSSRQRTGCILREPGGGGRSRATLSGAGVRLRLPLRPIHDLRTSG